MGVIRSIFISIAKPGIIAPHCEKDAELLAAGTKPVGLIAVKDCPEARLDPDYNKSFRDIDWLDGLVEEGRLHKTTIRGLPGTHTTPFIGHFYCQPGKEGDMQMLAEGHAALWAGVPVEELPNDPRKWGEYFGYTKADVDVFTNGEKNPIVRKLLNSTMGIRRKCRQHLMLQGVPTSEFE